jgi:uncharacterized protein YdhG (YjbR/CyaY superfamily)
VEEYLADTPARERQALERVREIVLDTLPEVFERIAYRIVVLAHHGDLVGLASQPRHLSLYTMSPGLVTSMAERLEPYKVSGATIQFTADDPLPADLIEEIVRKRLEENLARQTKT